MVYLTNDGTYVIISAFHPDQISEEDFDKFSIEFQPVEGRTPHAAMLHANAVLQQAGVLVTIVD